MDPSPRSKPPALSILQRPILKRRAQRRILKRRAPRIRRIHHWREWDGRGRIRQRTARQLPAGRRVAYRGRANSGGGAWLRGALDWEEPTRKVLDPVRIAGKDDDGIREEDYMSVLFDDPITATVSDPVTKSTAEYEVSQSGAQLPVLDEAHLFTSSDSSTLFDGSVSSSLGAMRPLVGKLDMLLAPAQEYYRRLPKRIKEWMHLLRDDVEEISSYLDELSEVEDPPPMAMCWMNEARELSYDMEDYIDSLLFVPPDHFSKKKKKKKKKKMVIKKRLKWHKQIAYVPRLPCKPKIAETISEFRTYVQEVIERHDRYRLHCSSTLGRSRFLSTGRIVPAPYEEADAIVIDGRMNEFINSLAANDATDQQPLKVVSILGSGCLGKTTLAEALYNRIGMQFDCIAFTRVSKKPDIKRLFRDLFLQLHQKMQPLPANCNELGISDNINKHLQNKRYLIVIDDLWDASVWDIINYAFPKGNCGSKIIITTQIEDVALTCCCDHSEHVFEMKPLDNDHSRKLFFNRIFGSESDCPEEFKQVSNEIIDICGGLPLATINIASHLANQEIEVSMDLLAYTHDSLRSYLWSNSTSERTRQVLNLGYNNLPRYLKTCLLYLRMYPEGSIIYKDDLVKQWVAEGFIATGKGVEKDQDMMEKEAGICFDELIDRRFIQPIYTNYNNKVVSYTVHDVVHDLIAQKSAEENFIVVVDYNRKNIALSHKVRRLSLIFGDAKYAKTPANIRKSQVRTLRFFGLFECMPCIREFKILRVLNLQLCGHHGNYDPLDLTGISELSQLRYLKIASDSSAKNTVDDAGVSRMCIPYDGLSSVSVAPVHLQTLELSRHCCIFSRLPRCLGELAKLRILKIAVGELLKEDIDILKGLPALTALSLHLLTISAERIVFGKGGFSVLTYFKFMCTVPWLKFEADAMPNLQKLKLCFNAPILDEHGATPIIIEHLSSGIKEISAKICCAGVDARSALLKAIRNDPRNPEVQLMCSIYYGHEGRGMLTPEGSGEDENNEAHSRIHMPPESPRLPVPAVRCREEELEDRPSISDIISIPSESEVTDKIHRLLGDESVLERIINGDEDPMDLPLALLLNITDGFSEERKIGQGGLGEVYKGILRNGIIVAVKKIHVNVTTIDDKSFHREINSLMKINHQNVVRFLGFCSHTYHRSIKEPGSEEITFVKVNERLLCSEYISNGSLDKHITDELRGLEWKTRYEIIMGICKGLCYLHTEKNFIHMGLKPGNILLDDHMVPKIMDFGLSRHNENLHTMGQRFRTRGYIAPEYENYGKNSFKADIYSLGAIIIELVTGCKGIPDKNNVLRRWRHRWGKPPTLLQYQQVTRCIEIAVCCRKIKPEHRPSILEIISILSEPESTDGHTGQESTYLDDDMLGIEPLELHFTFKLNKEMSCPVKLSNKTKACFAFNIERPSQQYTVRPDKGIVPAGCSEYFVQITVQPQERAPQVTQNADKFIVQSMKVSEGLRDKDITENMFCAEAGKVVDEVDLMVVYETGSRKRGQGPNVPVVAVSRKPKAVNSSSYEGGARGQRDRRNFHPPENFSCRQPMNETYLLRVSDRAVDVTRGAMGSLLHKLGELLKEELNLETSVKKDVQSLSEELMKMQPVLRRVSEVQQDNLEDLVKRWASNVREMSYDLEDFVDGFLVHNDPDSNTSGFRELTHEMCFLLEKGKSHQLIGDLIKDHISKQVDNVVPNASAIDDLRILAMYKHKAQLVGIETPRDELIRLFKEDGDVSKQNLKIVSIVGLGGLGKTTLAKAVYDELKAQFNPKTFVSVGQNPDVKKVLKNIIHKIVDMEFNAENLEVRELIEKLQELLEDKRYFIVIDDIWDSEAWGLIQSAFPETERGSRVITTTRIHDVALATCNAESKYVYRIKPLSDEDSRTLFFRRTFGSKKGCPDTPRKEEISIDILKRCGGMPLAINSIASLLAGKTDSTWEYVWKSLGAMTEGDDLEKMKQILDLSYIHLPDHLKTCLLYVCMYPEDREIDKNDLLSKWVAEGFVHVSRNSGLDAEDVAEKYFEELISMCMIQPGKIDDYSNEVLSCRVHDIILDLMRSKSSKENFIHVIDGSKDGTGQIRRVSFHYNDKNDTRVSETINKGSLSHVRSVLLCRSSLAACFLKFKYVRVLHLERDYYCNSLDLTSISRLFLLRYLKIAFPHGGTCQLKLPNQIGELQQLETIDIQGCSLKKYPSDIVSLPWLSHLSTTRNIAGVVLPDGIDRLTSLRTLAGVRLYKSSIDNILGLGKLTNLRKLEICLFTGSEEVITAIRMDALHSSISILSASLRICTFRKSFPLIDVSGWSSRTLFPRDSQIRELDLEGCIFQRCPECIGQLHGLTSFSIWVREVADGVSIVAGLPSLAYFSLKTCGIWTEEKEESEICVVQTEEKEESVVIPGGGAFQALKELIFHCKKAALTFEAGAMPKLEKLGVHSHFSMTRLFLPVGIQHLPAGTLKEILLEAHWDAAEVEGSQDWGASEWDDYSCSLEYIQLSMCVRSLWKGAFKRHHPDANIVVGLVVDYIGYDDGDRYADEDEEELLSVLVGQPELSGLVDLLSLLHYMFDSDSDEDEEDDGDNEATSTENEDEEDDGDNEATSTES